MYTCTEETYMKGPLHIVDPKGKENPYFNRKAPRYYCGLAVESFKASVIVQNDGRARVTFRPSDKDQGERATDYVPLDDARMCPTCKQNYLATDP